jgi:hypothetical protein
LSETDRVSLAQPGTRRAAQRVAQGSGGHAPERLHAVASKTVSKGKGAAAWRRQLRNDVRNLEQAMDELAALTERSQFKPAVLVLARREGGAMYLRWRSPGGFVNGSGLAQRLSSEPQTVRRWYAEADAQAALLNAQLSAARYALRLAQRIEHAEPV